MDSTKKLTKLIDNIKTELNNIKFDIELDIKDAYNKGLRDGGKYKLLSIIQDDNIDIKLLDMKSIRIFADWAYINGIDFSYMAKYPGEGKEYIDKVINRFNEDMKKEENDE